MASSSAITSGFTRGIILGILGAAITKNPNYFFIRVPKDIANEVVHENKGVNKSVPKSKHADQLRELA